MLDHAQAMDKKYRYVRHIYDITRLPFLLGRNRAISALGDCQGKTVLEIGCGTGRNLEVLSRRFPDAKIHGVDISEEMLSTSRAKLFKRPNVVLSRGDAETFDPVNDFNVERFDRVLMSFSLSMVPDWKKAFENALSMLHAGGVLSIVEFGDFHGFGPLRDWAVAELGRHKAPPIVTLKEDITIILAERHDLSVRFENAHFGFVQFVTVQS